MILTEKLELLCVFEISPWHFIIDELRNTRTSII